MRFIIIFFFLFEAVERSIGWFACGEWRNGKELF